MSLLLDALNKADQERKRNEDTPGISSKHENGGDDGHRKISNAVIALIVGIILILLLGAVYWFGQHTQANTSVMDKQPNSSTAATIKTAAASSTASVPLLTPVTPSVNENNEDTQSTPVENTAEEKVADLYQQQTESAPTHPTHVEQPLITPTPPAETIAAPNQAAPSSISQFANLPEIHDLPRSLLDKIPSLNYSQHNANNNGGSVVINGLVRHVNDQIAPGLVIDKILDDGMILHIDNFSFKMRALNSWLNM